MSEYGERHTVARLVGAPPGYVGYDEGCQLTEKVRRKPYSVLLLDEIEKAHPDVYNILLQVFDDGRLTDGKGRVVDFTNTIIIATSNLGSDIIQRRLKARGAADEEYEKTKAEVMDVLRGHFRPEFLNRIDEIIVFHALGKEEIRHIVGLQLDRVARSAASQGVTLTFDQTLIDHFAEEGYKPEFGARELKRLIRSELETALEREMLGGGIGKGDHASARWDDKAERVVFERKEPLQPPAEPEQPDAAKATEPEQPETVKVDEQLSALVSKIYGAHPFGGMGVAEEALYNGMGEDGMSRGLFWYLGTDDIKFEAGVASESMITSQAHSIVVLRFADEKQAADAAAKLKTTVDPRKWICVGVDEAKVVSKGKLVCVVMDDENGDYYINNFKANA